MLVDRESHRRNSVLEVCAKSGKRYPGVPLLIFAVISKAQMRRWPAQRYWRMNPLAACTVAVANLKCQKWIHPPTTAVQAQRRIAAFAASPQYQKRYTWVSLARISRDLQHAVIAGEDSRSTNITASIGRR